MGRINFRSLVMEELNLMLEAPSADMYIQQWFVQSKDGKDILTELEKMYSGKFTLNTIITEDKLRECFAATAEAKSRVGSTSVAAYANFLPLIDFLYLVGTELKTRGTNPNDIKEMLTGIRQTPGDVLDTVALRFYMDLSKRITGPSPLVDYTPLDPLAKNYQRIIKEDVFKNVVGEAALARFDNTSIQVALIGILKNLHAKTKGFFSEPLVQKIINEPEKYTGTSILPQDVKSQLGQANVMSIASIALRIKEFFNEQQIVAQTANSKDPTKVKNLTQLFTFSNNFTADRLVPVATDKNFEFTIYDTVAKKNDTIPANLDAEPDLLPGKGGYTIKNIKRMAQAKPNSKADKLVQELQSFGNFVGNKPQSNRAEKIAAFRGAVAQAAQAYNVGGKSVFGG